MSFGLYAYGHPPGVIVRHESDDDDDDCSPDVSQEEVGAESVDEDEASPGQVMPNAEAPAMLGNEAVHYARGAEENPFGAIDQIETADVAEENMITRIESHPYAHERINPLCDDRHKRKPLMLITLGRADLYGDPECKKLIDRGGVKHPEWYWKLKDGIIMCDDPTESNDIHQFDIPWYVVVKEKHNNAVGDHYHIAMTFSHTVRKCDLYPIIWKLFPREVNSGCPNITFFKSIDRLGSYLICPDKDKEVDPLPVMYNVPIEYIRGWKKKVRSINKGNAVAAVMKKHDLYTAIEMVDRDEPGFVFQNLKKFHAYKEVMTRIEMMKSIPDKAILRARVDAWETHVKRKELFDGEHLIT